MLIATLQKTDTNDRVFCNSQNNTTPRCEDLISFVWYSADDCVGIVARATILEPSTKRVLEWQAYIGVAKGIDEIDDVINIKNHGSKIGLDAALGFFPELSNIDAEYKHKTV